METKICIICGREFVRPKGKSRTVWAAQKCCGKDCSAISRRKDAPKSRYAMSRRKQLTPGARSLSFLKPSEAICRQ